MSGGTLEDRINEVGGPVRLLRGSQSGAYAFPMRGEYTNWRDETSEPGKRPRSCSTSRST